MTGRYMIGRVASGWLGTVLALVLLSAAVAPAQPVRTARVGFLWAGPRAAPGHVTTAAWSTSPGSARARVGRRPKPCCRVPIRGLEA